MTPRRALVTGGAGFIGSTLVDRLLAAGVTVDVVDDLSSGSLANLAEARADRANEVRFHHHDVAEPTVVELIARRRPEVVFHLAGRPGADRPPARHDLEARVDLLGTIHVLEGARAAGSAKVVVASSGTELYGEPDPAALPSRESTVAAAGSPRALARRVVTDYLALYRELYELEFTALVLASVYGPRQTARGEAGIVASLGEELLAGQPGTLPGDGTTSRDLLFVDDAVDAFVRAAQRGSGLVCNVGTGQETTLVELHRAMAALVGQPRHPRYSGGPATPPSRAALDAGRAAIHLGWSPFTPLEEGLRAVLRSCRPG